MAARDVAIGCGICAGGAAAVGSGAAIGVATAAIFEGGAELVSAEELQAARRPERTVTTPATKIRRLIAVTSLSFPSSYGQLKNRIG